MPAVLSSNWPPTICSATIWIARWRSTGSWRPCRKPRKEFRAIGFAGQVIVHDRRGDIAQAAQSLAEAMAYRNLLERQQGEELDRIAAKIRDIRGRAALKHALRVAARRPAPVRREHPATIGPNRVLLSGRS